LARVYDPGEHELTYDIIFPGDVPVGALTTELKTPEAIKLTVEKRVRKPVDVRVNFTGSAAENFMADTENRVLDFPTVRVSGPSSVVDLIDHARIDVDLTDRVESISENFRYTLCDADGKPVDVEMVTTDVGEIHLDVKIIRIKQIPLTMELNYGGGALEDTVEVAIEPANITVSGSEALLEDLNVIQLGALDLFVLEEDVEATYAISVPEGITNLSERTEAKVTVKFKNLAIKEIEVNQINMVGVPEGMEAELLNQVLKLRLRGPAVVMERLAPENVIVTVDFSGKELGSFTIKPSITIQGTEFAKVGAVGTYSVSATLREATPEETEG
jgi:YbbR domain-containing protein